jgi:prolyl-tRNA synthetase
MTGGAFARVLPSEADFTQWYDDIITRAELADYGPVDGTMIIRPYGYALWERIRTELDARIKACGAQNAYFPLFIPQAYLSRVPELEGLGSELAVVTKAGGAQLTDPVVVRFSSETVIGEFLAKWVQSYRDLPLLLNQWANVVRWEINPSLFMRTNEFLWQEGHTVHADQDEARDYARRIQREVYEDLMVNVMAIPAVAGIKSRRERSGGPELNTFTCEAMTGDGKALQMGTSIEGGQTFAKAFDIKYLSRDGRRELPWTTSWGASTRLIGGLIMAHGDSDGLRIPPALAPTQIVVMAVNAAVVGLVHAIATEMREAGLRVFTDDRTDIEFGQRVARWGLKGVPLRVEIGKGELDAGTAILARRLSEASKTAVPLPELTTRATRLIEDEQRAMLDAARAERDSRITVVGTVAEAAAAAAGGWAKLPWSALAETGEDELARSGVTVRCLQRPDGSTPDSDAEPDLVAFVARAY